MHVCAEVPVRLQVDAGVVDRLYIDKLRECFASSETYAFHDKEAVLSEIVARMARYVQGGIILVPVVHGDCWFANIIVTSANELKFVDMRGRVGSLLTMNGDASYDYGKLCQSLVGVDEVVFGLRPGPHAYRLELLGAFVACLRKTGASPASVLDVAICLIAGALPFSAAGVRAGLWGLVVQLLFPSTQDYREIVAAMGV